MPVFLLFVRTSILERIDFVLYIEANVTGLLCVLIWFIHSVMSNLCDPLNHSKPGLPVHHQLPQSTQTHVHRVGDAIQSSHPLLSSSLPTFNLFSIKDFSNESALCIRWPKYWSCSFSISPSNEQD